MKKVILLCLLLSGCYPYTYKTQVGTELNCVQNDTKVTCEIKEEYEENTSWSLGPRPYALGIGPVVSILVIEVSKALAAETIKDLIIEEYRKRYVRKHVPTKLTLLKSH